MRITLYSFLTFFLATMAMGNAQAQFAWIDPPEPDVREEITIYVDLAQDPGCSNITNSEGPLYLWTWNPSEPTVENGNGEWSNSNDTLEMTHEEGTIWSFTMVPAEFYNVTNYRDIYQTGLSFLVKEKDGGGGGDCAEGGGEFKTSDINLSIPSPFVEPVYSIPTIEGDTAIFSRSDDIFSIVYDNKLEEKVDLIGATDLYVYIRGYDENGTQYIPTTLFNVDDDENLRMTDTGNSVYAYSFVPKDRFADLIPEGSYLQSFDIQILEGPFCGTTDCVVDGVFSFEYPCED